MIDGLEDFFDTDDFAEVVTMKGKQVKAIFDIVQLDHADGFGVVKSYAPHLTVQTKDITTLEQGDLVVVRGTNYEVSNTDDDGTGESTVYLYLKT